MLIMAKEDSGSVLDPIFIDDEDASEGGKKSGAITVEGSAAAASAVLLHTFKCRRTGIRLAASRVAALAGFQPFCVLPKIALDLVYQGWVGRLLLQQDARLLGLVLQSDEEKLLELAAKAGSTSVMQAVRTAVDAGNGDVTLPTTDDAAKLKQHALSQAQKTGRLNKKELNALSEEVRRCVDTGFGTQHEDVALDQYEASCGYEVRQRNSEVRFWDFICAEDLANDTNIDTPGTRGNRPEPTVVPLGPAKRMKEKYVVTIPDIIQDDNDEPDCKRLKLNKEVSDISTSEIEDMEATRGEEKKMEPQEVCTNGDGGGRSIDADTEQNQAGNVELSSFASDGNKMGRGMEPKPFFSIAGSIDGMRDELYPRPSCSSNNDSEDSLNNSYDNDIWDMREVLVECKHRMKRAIVPPPIYDQIQTIVYSLMYGVEEADIVQVVRRRKHTSIQKTRKSQNEESVTKSTAVDPPKNDENVTNSKTQQAKGLDKFFLPNEGLAHKLEEAPTKDINTPSNSENENDSTNNVIRIREDASLTTNENTAVTEYLLPKDGRDEVESKGEISSDEVVVTTNIDITTSRVSLNDPIMQHGQNWVNVILPRLRSFVDTVYSIREDDDKRYRLLTAVSSNDNGGDDDVDSAAWEMLLLECPWLRHCDIAYHRR
mmetsp:Transcript_25387/g.45976  ORF Transcript_25387/g.45976 Transcript_25387/m.45976 type:complete len:656 (-) Transcript_25387:76-2043(-)